MSDKQKAIDSLLDEFFGPSGSTQEAPEPPVTQQPTEVPAKAKKERRPRKQKEVPQNPFADLNIDNLPERVEEVINLLGHEEQFVPYKLWAGARYPEAKPGLRKLMKDLGYEIVDSEQREDSKALKWARYSDGETVVLLNYGATVDGIRGHMISKEAL